MKYYSEDTVKKIIADTVNATLHICEPKEDYPCIEIEEPHGDLVDRQKLIKALSKAWDVDDDQDFANKSVWRIVEKEAPTVIEASTEERG